MDPRWRNGRCHFLGPLEMPFSETPKIWYLASLQVSFHSRKNTTSFSEYFLYLLRLSLPRKKFKRDWFGALWYKFPFPMLIPTRSMMVRIESETLLCFCPGKLILHSGESSKISTCAVSCEKLDKSCWSFEENVHSVLELVMYDRISLLLRKKETSFGIRELSARKKTRTDFVQRPAALTRLLK